MTIELTILALATVLGLFHLILAAACKRTQDGMQWAAGPRDEVKTYTGIAARLDRAEANFLETFPYFAVAILLVHLAGREGALSAWGAWLYLIARVVYIPLYASGIANWRSLAWGLSMVGLAMVLAALA